MTNEYLRAHLDRIYQRHGRLDPADVVDEARPESSPLHPYFEWDDAQAAEAHRVEQARGLIRRVRYVIQEEPLKQSRWFVSVDPGGEEGARSYMPLPAVASDDALRQRVLDEAKRDLDRLARKYAYLGEAFAALLREHLSGEDAA